MTQTML